MNTSEDSGTKLRERILVGSRVLKMHTCVLVDSFMRAHAPGTRPACASLPREMAWLWAKKGSLRVLPFGALPGGPGCRVFEKASAFLCWLKLKSKCEEDTLHPG